MHLIFSGLVNTFLSIRARFLGVNTNTWVFFFVEVGGESCCWVSIDSQEKVIEEERRKGGKGNKEEQRNKEKLYHQH